MIFSAQIYTLSFSIYNKLFANRNIIVSYNAKINKQTKFEGYNKIYKNVSILGTSIGRGSYIGWNSILNKGSIGRFCSIAPFVECVYGVHSLDPFVSTHPAFFSIKKQAGFTFVPSQRFQEHRLTESGNSFVIGNDVWIGYGVKIMEGVSIGDGAVVAAGAIVTKNIPAFEIWGGVPAKKIKDRFSEEVKSKLSSIKWWQMDVSELRLREEAFHNITSFINHFS